MGFPLWPFWEQSLSGKEIYILGPRQSQAISNLTKRTNV